MRSASSRQAPAPKPPRKQRDVPRPMARCAASCRSARRHNLPRLPTSHPKAKAGSAKSSSTVIACCVGRTAATVRVVTRNGLDWTDRLPAVAREIGKLRVDTALLDGELVALDTNGASSFPALQAALSAGKDATLHLYLFDLLHLDGWDLRPCHLVDRKRVLFELADWKGHAALQRPPHRRRGPHASRGVRHGPGRHHLQAG